MDDTQAALMMAVREAYEWLLQWLEEAVSTRSDTEHLSRQMQLNQQMMERAVEAPAVAGAAAAGAVTTAAKFLGIIADNAPDLAEQLVQEMRDEIDNAGTTYVDDTVNRYLP